ncbi:MAG TPA: DUF4124 domain-containing protein [Gammaproteobacteria bacterium]|nr:DUF4124 domain-containing protein [Gammaproteobacteria bacterium]
MNRLLASSLAVCALLLPALAIAGNPQMFKWTDAQGVVHYSDQPPKQAAADMQTLDIPLFPPQDPAEIAAREAALAAQVAALQKLVDTQAAQQGQARALAEKESQLQAALAAVQQEAYDDQRESPPLIYSTSAFIPHAFRRDLYVFHRPSGPPLQMRIRTPGLSMPLKH